MLFAASFLFLLAVFKFQLLAVDCPRNEEELEGKSLQDLVDIEEACQKKIENLQGQQKTLASAIGFLNNKVQLTITQITTTEEQLKILVKEIADLSVKINILDSSITDVSAILTSRIEATYKRERIKPVYLFFVSQGFSDFFNRLQYLKAAQLHDRQLLYGMQKSKMNYDSQKDLKKEKQTLQENLKKKLETQKATLAQQKQAKQELLEITKNDEKTFQQLLAATRAEMEAIQAIIAGQGEETKVGDVSQGERIASIIQGVSACSTGTHLHFEMADGKDIKNPFGYLKCVSFNDRSDGDNFSCTGSWNWPVDEPVDFHQGFGSDTSFIRSGTAWYDFHTGIDINNPSAKVKAVKDGVLYQGSIACGGGTLRYVKVDHKDSNIDTYYVHVNYY